MAVEKIVNIKIKDNANEVEQDINSLNQSGKKLEQTFKDVNATFEDVYGELKPLTSRLGEAEDRLYELALAGKQNTQEYKELLKATANYRQVQIDTDLVVDMAAQRLNMKMVSALEGVAGAFAVVRGSMGLFVTESEELDKALLKVQSAMALVQGIEGIRTAMPVFSALGNVIKTNVVGAFKTLKGAIMATGIGALVVAIGGLIYAMEEYNDSLEDAAENQEKLNEEQQKSLDIINETIAASEKSRNNKKGGLEDLKNELDLLKAKGATEEEIYNKSKQILDKELYNLKVRYYSYNQTSKKEREAAWDTYYQIKDVRNQMAVLEAEYSRFLSDEQKERKKEEDEKRNTRLQKEAEDAAKRNEIERQRLINLKNLEREFLAEIEQVESEYYDSKLSQEEQEVRKVEDKYFNLLNKAQEYNDNLTEKEQNKRINTVALEEARLSELAAIQKEYDDKRLEEEQKLKDKKKADDEKDLADELARLEMKKKLTYETFSAINGIISAFAGANEEQQRKAFEIQKAVSIAQTIIDTYKGAQAIFASAAANPSTILFPAQPFITAGLAVASGLANVKKIASTQFNSGVGSASSPSVPNVAGNTSTQQLSSPNFNVVGASGISQTENLQPVKAYVVSGDVTSAQALDRNRIQNATF